MISSTMSEDNVVVKSLQPNANSKIELHSMASMMVVMLPFPPLPVICLSGDGLTETHASGHDLLSSAISSNVLTSGQNSSKFCTENQHKKNGVLVAMNHSISAIWHGNGAMTVDDCLLMCYIQYCKSFREYMSCYPGSLDIRIMPMDTVDKESNIHRQAIQHLNAHRVTTEDGEIFKVAETCMDYRCLMRMYVEQMYSQSDLVKSLS